MKKKVAVIGYGGMGGWHCEHLQNSDVAELAARLRREGKILSEEYGESGLLVTALAAGRLLDSLKAYEIQP